MEKLTLVGELSKINKLIFAESIDTEPINNINKILLDLNTAIRSGGLSINSKYQETVKSMQSALLLLGYVLPIYGADGIYGKETQSAINNFISKNKLSPSINKAMPEILAKIASQLQNKNTSNPQITKQQPTTKSNNIFTDINLATNEGYTQYANVCDKFISTKVNPLNITGEMMAYAAQNAFNKYQSYIPPELALGQLIIEGGIGNKNLNSKPIRTKNPFNIGNWDAGKTTIHKTVQDSINAYYNAIGRDYLSGKKSAISLLTNFTNYADNRYASDPNYENKLFSIVKNVNKIINSTT